MPSAAMQAKAERLLREGALQYQEDGETLTVRGEHGEYEIGVDAAGKPYCTCQARGQCAHLLAAQMLERGEIPMAAERNGGFDPKAHLMQLKGKDYLEVKWRLMWFREQHPAASGWGIRTVCEEVTEDSARYRAQIVSPEGVIVAEGTKTETKRGFADFVEKAETGAIGRALALCGYGTQFCGDELDEGERIVDSPVAVPQRRPPVRHGIIGPTPPPPAVEEPPAEEDRFAREGGGEVASLRPAPRWKDQGEFFTSLRGLGYGTSDQREDLRAQLGIRNDWKAMTPEEQLAIYNLARELQQEAAA